MTQENNAKHIMLVEDDMSLAEWFSDYLISQGYMVTLANRGDTAIDLIRTDEPDLVVLDIMLPVKDGFDVCKEVRYFYTGPILMMTARDHETDEVLGLELGADDYLTKPVKPRVLLARVKALLRRVSAEKHVQAQHSNLIEYGQLRINADSRTTQLNNKNITISSNEFDVLWILAKSASQVVYRDELSQQIKGVEYDGFDRSMDIIVSRLRKKLGDNANEPFRIKTVWGKGYLLAKDAWV